MKRILSILMAALLLVSAIPTAFAAEGEHDYSNGTQITLVGTQETQGAQWTVTVPAKMQPGQTGTVTAQGTWAADQFINVHAPKTVTLTYGAQSMDVGITFGKSCGFSKIGSNTEDVTYSADITVAEANRLFGEWTGLVEYTVTLIKNGDVNRDGVIDTNDSDAIRRHLLSPEHENYKELTAQELIYADLDGDGYINTVDSTKIIQAVNGFCAHDAVNAVQPVETVLLGDANGNGAVAVDDATTISRTVRNMDYNICTTNAQLVAADVNQDGVVSDADADTIEKYIASAQNEEQYPNINKPVTVGSSIPTVKYVSMISFTVDGTEYTVEEGMTWGLWIYTEYPGFTCDNNTNAVYDANGNIVNDVLATDTINANGVYTTNAE